MKPRPTAARGNSAITKLAQLTPDPKNANAGTKRGAALLEDSLRKYGAGRSILIDKHGRIIAGNKTVEQAGQIGLDDVQVVQSDGKRIIAVQRTDLDLSKDKAAKELAIADNRVAQIDLSWDAETLKSLAEEIDLSQFFTDAELRDYIGEDQRDAVEMQSAAHFDELQEKWGTKLGQLWQIGEHRVICGVAADREIVSRLLRHDKPSLMVTDPPYGVNYDPGWRAKDGNVNRAVGKVSNDDRADWREAFALFPGDVAYIWHSSLHAARFISAIESCGFSLRSVMIWVKPNIIIGRGHYHWQHEPCIYAVRNGATAKWKGGRKQSTVWEVDAATEGDDAATGHSTQKPVELFTRPIANHTEKGEFIYDPFLGSGTALMAAQQTSRKCLGCEIDPKYVAAILERAAHAGIEPIFKLNTVK